MVIAMFNAIKDREWGWGFLKPKKFGIKLTLYGKENFQPEDRTVIPFCNFVGVPLFSEIHHVT